MRRIEMLSLLLIMPALTSFAMTPDDVHALVERVDRNSSPIQYESDLALKNYGPGQPDGTAGPCLQKRRQSSCRHNRSRHSEGTGHHQEHG